jgi:hypothetical protein
MTSYIFTSYIQESIHYSLLYILLCPLSFPTILLISNIFYSEFSDVCALLHDLFRGWQVLLLPRTKKQEKRVARSDTI